MVQRVSRKALALAAVGVLAAPSRSKDAETANAVLVTLRVTSNPTGGLQFSFPPALEEYETSLEEFNESVAKLLSSVTDAGSKFLDFSNQLLEDKRTIEELNTPTQSSPEPKVQILGELKSNLRQQAELKAAEQILAFAAIEVGVTYQELSEAIGTSVATAHRRYNPESAEKSRQNTENARKRS
jgi:hypothetical protein